MKCPICHGKGRIQDHKYNEEHDIEYLVYCEKKCEYCNGTGEVNEPLQTNEEWFCSLSTEEKAKVFANATYSTALAPMEILALGKEFEQKKWEMWLKQPHKDGES